MTQELYINGQMCDLGEEEPSLIFQSPIFNDLDVIQSNRSAEISLPLTPRNRAAFGLIDRIDLADDTMAYKRYPAAYYLGGFPVFTRGRAVVTDITDTINITLVWGNIDNFQPLFDASLRDLGPQFAQLLGEDYVQWNESVKYITRADAALAGFFAVDFGHGLQGATPDGAAWKYSHPSVYASVVLDAIRLYHGITIDGIDDKVDGHNLLVPLLSRNASEASWPVDRFEASAGSCTHWHDDQYVIHFLSRYIVTNRRNIAVDSNAWENVYFNVANVKKVRVSILSKDGNPIEFQGSRYDSSKPCRLILEGSRTDGENGNIYIWEDVSTSGHIEFAVRDICDDKEFDVEDYEFISWRLENYSTYNNQGSFVEATFQVEPEFDDIMFPSPFPLAENLPDMTHAEFLGALMTMQGLFAYADNTDDNIIRMMSPDYFYQVLSVKAYDYRIVTPQQGLLIDQRIVSPVANYRIVARRPGVVDWSRQVILNEKGEIWRPEGTEFTMGDYAQVNTLDYDNDDDAEKLGTQGEIVIENENIDEEYELASLPFSGSANELDTDPNSPHYETSHAVIPCYEGDNYSEPSPRILAMMMRDYGTSDDPAADIRYGVFLRELYFGGQRGIVAREYEAFQRILRRFRMITVYVKLSAYDIANISYMTPVYIDVYGCYFAIYSVTTGEDGICECKLIKL